MARVTVTVTARDLTGPQLQRMRQNFNRLGQDMDRVLTQRTRQNFTRLQQSINSTRRDLTALRGSIPDDEFFRLDAAIRRAQHRMQRGFRHTDLNRVAADVRRVRRGFRDLDRDSQIRVRIDTTALRRADARLDAWRRMQSRDGVRVPVRPDVNRNRLRSGLMGALTAPVRAVGRLLGGTLSDGLGQGISNAFKGAGPYIAAALVVAITAALAIAGAALSGLLVTTLGAAFVGIGGVSAAMSTEVKEHWSKALVSMKKDFKSVGEPMIPVLQRGIDKIEEMSGKAAPKLKKAIEEAVPATDKFIAGILKGFESFGKAAFKPIMDAWNVFAPVFGGEWDEFMDELGNSFGRMADLVREHPEEIAAALDIVFEALDLLVDSITFLGKTWVFMRQNAGDAFGFIIQGVRGLLIAVNEALYAILDGATKAFGWVPGLGGKLKDARRSFGEFKDDVAAKLEQAAESAFAWDDALNKANRKRTLEANISTWNAQITAAKKKLESVPKSKQAKLKADIADLRSKVQRAKDELASIKNKFVSINVTTYYHAVGSGQINGRTSDQMGRRMGGNIGAAASGGVRNNMTLVGEAGPELVSLPAGSHVKSNPDTRRAMAGSGGGGGQPIQVNLVVDGKKLASVMVDPLRGEIRDRGGNVQNAIGVRGK